METLGQVPSKANCEPSRMNGWVLSPGPDDPSYTVIRGEVENWARAWNLFEPWVIDAAMFTLQNTPSGVVLKGFFRPQYKLPQTLTIQDHLAESFASTRIEPGFDNFNDFTVEGVKLWKDVLLELCEIFIDHYIADRFEIVEGKTFPWSRETFERYIDWCVQYQVQEVSFHTLAQETGFTRQTVTGAVKEVTTYMKLNLRPPSKGGRPKKGAG